MVDNTGRNAGVAENPSSTAFDIIVHSLTKYMGGHGKLARRRDRRWRQVSRGPSRPNAIPCFTTPEPSYHGVVYADALGPGRPTSGAPATVPAAQTPALRSRHSTPSCSCRASRRSACAWSGTANNALAVGQTPARPPEGGLGAVRRPARRPLSRLGAALHERSCFQHPHVRREGAASTPA